METSLEQRKIPVKYIWIDLCHTPHVIFFKPVIERLQEEGFVVLVTVREAFETTDLAKKHLHNYLVIGKHYGKHTLNKLAGLFIRSFQLVLFAFDKKIDLAISHGSPYQILAALLLGIPTLLFGDYEQSSVFRVGFFANKIVMPERVSDHALVARNINLRKVLRFSGIKENVYVPHFKSNGAVLHQLGLDSQKIIVTVRPPADKAHYHHERAEHLLTCILNYLIRKPEIQVVVLPRDDEQEQRLRREYDHRIIIPAQSVDSLSLIYHSDAVFGGGGTMNREAAVLNVPVYSFFQGRIGSIDQYLAKTGKLEFINSVEQIEKLRIRKKSTKQSPETIYDSLPQVISIIKEELLIQ